MLDKSNIEYESKVINDKHRGLFDEDDDFD